MAPDTADTLSLCIIGTEHSTDTHLKASATDENAISSKGMAAGENSRVSKLSDVLLAILKGGRSLARKSMYACTTVAPNYNLHSEPTL